MNKVYWGLALGLAIFLLGVWLGRATKKIPPTTVYAIDTVLTRELIHDTTVVTETVIRSQTDTLYITKDTPLGDIPVRTPVFADSIPFRIGDKTAYMPFDLGIKYRGLLYGYTLTTHPQPYKISMEKHLIKPYGTVTALVDHNLHLYAEAELGAVVLDRAGFLIRGQMTQDNLAVLAGVKYVLF